MLSQLEQVCKTYSTESFSGLIEFDSNWQRIFVTALTFHLDQATDCAKTRFLEQIWLFKHFLEKGPFSNRFAKLSSVLGPQV